MTISRITPTGAFVSVKRHGAQVSLFGAYLTGKVEAMSLGYQKHDAAAYLDVPNLNVIRPRISADNVFGRLYGFAHMVARTVTVVTLVTPVILTLPFALVISGAIWDLWVSYLVWTMSVGGVTFVKLAQWASARSDIFSDDLRRSLSSFQSECVAHSFAATKEMVESAFGLPMESIFSVFEEECLASGSIGQVHRAVLRGSNEEVAVKIIHPWVPDMLASDLVIFRYICNVLSLIPMMKWWDIQTVGEEFSLNMMEQINLCNEADLLDHFNVNFRGRKRIRFPRPIRPLVARLVLVETFERGVHISQYVEERLKEVKENKRVSGESVGDEKGGEFSQQDVSPIHRYLAHLGLVSFLQMVLVDNLVHIDLHPGNVLVDCSVSTTEPTMVVLDTGMAASLRSNRLEYFMQLFEALATKNGKAGAELFLKYSKLNNCDDEHAFRADVEQLISAQSNEDGDSFTKFMGLVFSLFHKHHVLFEGEFVTIMNGMMIVEGLGRSLDENINVVHTALPFLFRANARGLKPLIQHTWDTGREESAASNASSQTVLIDIGM
jgi:aarF domain-containing kinase